MPRERNGQERRGRERHDGDGRDGDRCNSHRLELRERARRWQHFLLGRPVHGGDPIELCFSGGWVTGRHEWAGPEHAPRLFFSVELGGGRGWESWLELPEGALLSWPGRMGE